MLSIATAKILKEKGYSFEQIQGIELGLQQSQKGETVSQSEMDSFIKNELFAQYSVNA
ncbi:MAG: hypothetical protein PHN60_01155 [Candidatus Gracilibacteria bacterium]|nr:hypothetical protein [Candidatus Gracilibacteria bacterium]